MAAIHEDDIKTITLGFLRGYYKHRPRSGDIKTETNLRGEGGIVVDSYLSYPDELGKPFIATAEATSVDTRAEVQYSVQHRLLFWDSLVFGTLMTILYYVFSASIPSLSMPGLTPAVRALSLLFSIVLFTALYNKGIRPLRRYRYIYAIAQFKKYTANEQWVALAKAVFPLLDKDAYYRELKRQCTRFGFGLILVNNQLQPRLVLSPSRAEQFTRPRQEVKLFSLGAYKKLQEFGHQDWFLIRWWNNWTNPYKEHDYFRFKSGFYNQMALIGLGLIVNVVFFLQETKRMPVYFPNESQYVKKLEQEANNLEEEEDINHDPKPFIVPFEEKLTDENIIGLHMPEGSESYTENNSKPGAEVLIYDPYNQTIITYDCERMYNFRDTKYLIEIGAYENLYKARNQLQILGDAGINGIAFWEGCFSPSRDAFILYIETMHNNLDEAQIALDSLTGKLSNLSVQARIRPISPVIDNR